MTTDESISMTDPDLLDWLRRNWRQDGRRLKYVCSCWDYDIRGHRYWPFK